MMLELHLKLFQIRQNVPHYYRYFRSPCVDYLPRLLPVESEMAHFQVVLPLQWADSGHRPIVVHYAGTGDHFFWRRRRMMALPLLRERQVASIILENPFYGLRKPKHQLRSCLDQVTDLFVMGACLILESLVLFNWCEKEGFSPIIAHGISSNSHCLPVLHSKLIGTFFLTVGGHMASLGASVWPKPLGLVPCLSWTSASLTFTRGVLTGAIPWDLLEKQYASYNAYRDEVVSLIENEKSAHRAGVDFAHQMDQIAQLKMEADEQNCRRWPVSDSMAVKSYPNEEKIKEDRAIKHELSDQAVKKLKVQGSNSGYTNILEALQLPFLSSMSTKLPFVSDTNAAGRKSIKANDEGSFSRYMLPKIIRADASGSKSESDSLHREAVQFMRGIMDECTHLKNYEVPYDPSLIFIVVAEIDAYQPREGISALPDIWPGANLRYIEGKGHVSSYLLKQNEFRKAIYDCIDKYTAKYASVS